MGRLIGAFDWSSTPLGPVATWPTSLRVAVGIILRSPIAMALVWGEQGVLLYNDNYAEGAGQRHPAILGRGIAQAWPEIAEYTANLLKAGLAGQSQAVKDQHLRLFRNGIAEDVWFDIASSPVLDDAGRPGGVLVVMTDTTARNLADERLRIAQEVGRVGTFEWYPQTNRLVVSDVYREIYGLTPEEDVTDFRLMQLLPPEDHKFAGNIRYGHTDNPLAYAEYRIRHPVTGEIRWIARRGETLDLGPDAPQRFIGVSVDITDRKQAAEHDAFLTELSDRLRDMTDALLVVTVASEMLGRYLNVGRIGYGEIDAEGEHVTIERDWTDGTLPSLAGRHVIDAFGTATANALRHGQTVRVQDARTDPRLQDPDIAAAYASIRTRSGLAVPLTRDGRFTGVLFAHDDEPRVWTDADEAIMDAVAARTWDSAQRARAEQRLRESEENFRQLAEAMPINVFVTDPDGRLLWVNQQAHDYTGQPQGELLRADWTRLVHPDDQEHAFGSWAGAIRAGVPSDYEYRILRHDGTYRWHLARVLPIRDADGKVLRWIGTNTEIEDQRRALTALAEINATLEERVEARTRALRQAEDALRQAQKMDAIGQLTGGIAHDFNNLLTGIMGSLELLQRRIARHFPPGDDRLPDLDRFMEAATSSAQRAAALTHRLLTFARRQSLDSRPTDVALLVQGMADLLRRTLGEQVDPRIEAACCWHAMTDPNQLESAILNLAINARDAMPDGGQLTIAATNMLLEPPRRIGRLEPGAYVAITVTDTGTGMPDDVKQKAFEPFFTTKPTGQGTGLGLSMVYGFVSQSGGDVHIDSTPGQGTSVTLYLPRACTDAQPHEAPSREAPQLGAGETVLLIEDVPAVRMLIVDVLEELGYRVIEAADGSEALPILDSGRQIDLLVSDVGLPGLNGRQIADYARTRRPGLKVLFVTGYAGDAASRAGGLEPGMAMITKPFAMEQLATKIRQIMAD